MLNKKVLLGALITAFLSSNVSYAKTEGAYVGADISRYNVINKLPSPRNEQISTAFGINAKYAINFNNVFIAPGIFADFNSAKEEKITAVNSTKKSVRNRYGIRADLGYDLTDKFALYATGGFATVNTSYESNTLSGSDWISYKKSYYRSGAIYGAGLYYNYSNNITFNAEYNTQLIKAKFEPFAIGYQDKYRINALKLGVSYHF